MSYISTIYTLNNLLVFNSRALCIWTWVWPPFGGKYISSFLLVGEKSDPSGQISSTFLNHTVQHILTYSFLDFWKLLQLWTQFLLLCTLWSLTLPTWFTDCLVSIFSNFSLGAWGSSLIEVKDLISVSSVCSATK